MMKIIQWVKRNGILLCLIGFAIIRWYLAQKLPILAFPAEVYDDGLMVKLAKNLIEGKWLGAYDSNTLMKGIGFPLFLCILKNLQISYLTAMNGLYILACFYFVRCYSKRF